MRRKSNLWTIALWVAVGTFFSSQIKDLAGKIPFLKDIINKTEA
jgi:hypothetical protein